jgi:DNA-binding MarR family transcriptional regulator
MYRRRDPSAPEVMGVLDDFRRIVRALRQSSRAAQQRLGVTGAQLFVLKTLSAQSLSMNELAVRTRTHQSTVSVVVKRLVARGLVSRAVSHSDARIVELTVTKRGRALLEHAPSAAQEKLIEGIERLSAMERRVLAKALHRLIDAMQLTDEAPEMFFEEESPPAKSRRKRSRG